MKYKCDSNGTLEYKGQWKQGRKEGNGTETYRNLNKGKISSYTGEFKAGVKHGHGILRQDNGYLYEGSWEEGAKDGYAIE